jgi:hypothetical protein
MAWICLNDSFVSVIADQKNEELLVVRARRKEHLFNLPGNGIEVTVTPERDYKYRTKAARRRFAQIVASRIEQIEYGNFKDSVADEDLHDLYKQFWVLHKEYQE